MSSDEDVEGAHPAVRWGKLTSFGAGFGDCNRDRDPAPSWGAEDAKRLHRAFDATQG
jgi:hypothetical protein